MDKFKVGDRVRIRSWESMEKEFGTDYHGSISTFYPFFSDMKHLCGRTATISSVEVSKGVRLGDWSNTNGDIAWLYSTDMLEPAKERYGHLYSESQGGEFGRIGTPTKMHDCNGEKLFVGDVVETFCREGNSYGERFVAEDCDSQFVSGIKCECRKDGKIEDGWYVKKKRSYTEILDGEKLEHLTFRIESDPRFETGQVYRIEKIINDKDWNGSIFKICGKSHDFSGNLITTKPIRGESPESFYEGSITSKSVTLLTGREIGEAIRQWDADHAKKDSEYNEIKRHARVGEKIKVVKLDCANGYGIGDVGTVTMSNDNGIYADFCTGKHGLYHSEYVVLEPRVKEVKRVAKAGEYIKLIRTIYSFDKIGDVILINCVESGLAVGESHRSIIDDATWPYPSTSYVVLEGYKPEKKGKHVYTEEQIDEANKITLNMIKEVYSNGDEALFFSHADKKTYYAFLIKNGTCCDVEVTSSPVGSTTTIHSMTDGTIVSNATCSNNDEPNEWIGKCVALCKVLHKPIPKFIMDGD